MFPLTGSASTFSRVLRCVPFTRRTIALRSRSASVRRRIAENAWYDAQRMKGTSSVPSYPQIAASLVGNWRDHHLFALRQALAVFEFYVSQLAECDTEIERAMALLL